MEMFGRGGVGVWETYYSASKEMILKMGHRDGEMLIREQVGGLEDSFLGFCHSCHLGPLPAF